MKRVWLGLVLMAAFPVFADISLTDHGRMTKAERDARHAARAKANAELKAKSDASRSAVHRGRARTNSGQAPSNQNTIRNLVDASGLQYEISTNVTTSTFVSSASGAAQEANYTAAVAGTSSGVAITDTFTDAFDGYNALCVSPTQSHTACVDNNPTNFIVYNHNGAASFDSCPSDPNHQLVFPVQNMTVNGQSVAVQRKVYVPSNDTFARWLNLFTNNGSSAVSFSMVTNNNLGSDSNTKILLTSSGDATVTTSDTWVTTGQAATSSPTSATNCCNNDPRIAHILQTSGAAIPLAFVHFANGDDGPYWGYDLTLQPGQTVGIVNYASGQPTIAKANAAAARLAGLPPTTEQCLSPTEIAEVANFDLAEATGGVPALSARALMLLAAALAAIAFVALKR